MSEATPTGFSPRNAARVVRATRYVESVARYTEEADYGTPVIGQDQNGGSSPAAWFWARISGTPVSIGTRKWKLPWVSVRRTLTGWEDVPGGVVSHDGTGGYPDTRAINGIEEPNGVSGIQGNGIDASSLTAGPGIFDLVPLGVGAVVMIWMDVLSDGTEVFTCPYVNQVDGSCP